MTFYSGAGNTFLLFDNRKNSFFEPEAAPLCERHGVDGCILVETSEQADVSMRTFNRDGSEAEMCGNGLRCLIHFLRHLGIDRERYSVETAAGIHYGWLEGEFVATQLPPPTDLRWNLYGEDLHHLNTGVPHLVRFIPSFETLDLLEEGRRLRHDLMLAPQGANVNFVVVGQDQTLSIRTYERGVERETLACGTGATASALAASKIHGFSSPVTLYVRSGERLKISFSSDWQRLTLVGGVKSFENIAPTPV